MSNLLSLDRRMVLERAKAMEKKRTQPCKRQHKRVSLNSPPAMLKRLPERPATLCHV